MYPRWFNTAVVVLWMSAMGWLLIEKVLPPLLIGEPPKYSTAMAEEQDEALPVSWELTLNGRPLGWATSATLPRPDGVVELQSRVHLDRFPMAEIAPSWLANILEPLAARDGEMSIDTASTFELLGDRLERFRTTVDLGPLPNAILVTGEVEGEKLRFTARAGDFRYSHAIDLPPDALVGDGLSPRSRLARLHVGQTWTEPIYSPFHQPNNPMQILQATVERREPLSWNGEVVNVALVVYRNDPGSELNASRLARGRAWVRDDGTVLKQEVVVLGSRLLFTRLPPGELSEIGWPTVDSSAVRPTEANDSSQ